MKFDELTPGEEIDVYEALEGQGHLSQLGKVALEQKKKEFYS